MYELLVSILGGLSPRPVPLESPRVAPFHRIPELGEIREASLAPNGVVWVVGSGGLLELESGRFLQLPEGEAGGLTTLAASPFLVVGGPSGLWVEGHSRLFPVHPRERALRLVGASWGCLALTEDSRGGFHLRGCRAAGERWHEVFRLPGGAQDLVTDGRGRAYLLESGGIRQASWGGCGPSQPLPQDCQQPAHLSVWEDRLLIADQDLRCWLGSGQGESDWRLLEARGRPGRTARGLVLGNETGLHLVNPGGDLEEDGRDLEASLRGGPLRSSGSDGVGLDLVWNSRALLRPGLRQWRPRYLSARTPQSAGSFGRTEAGHLWVSDQQGRLFHRANDGTWTGFFLPEGLAHDGLALGVDGEAVLFSAHDPEREYQRGESLFWLAGPRGEEGGAFVTREPRAISLGPRKGKPVRAVAALGSVIFAAIGGELVRISDRSHRVWGQSEGLPGEEILALATLFDDLWAVTEGASGPLRFLRGCLDLESPGDEGPAGRTVSLTADNQSGQLWVGFEDGEKGGVGSLSREGVWISQLRLPSPPQGLAAYGGAVVVSCEASLILLESGERLRRTLGEEQGLPGRPLGALGMIPGEILVDSEVGLYRSLLEVKQAPVEAASEGVSPPVFERIEV